MEKLPSFQRASPGVLHEFLLFWLNSMKRRGKTFSCCSESSISTSIVAEIESLNV